MAKILTVAEQFELYLDRIDMSKSRMHPVQYIETRRAFFGGVGQILNSARDDVTKLPDEEGAMVFENWWQECVDFWDKEVREHDSRREDVSDG